MNKVLKGLLLSLMIVTLSVNVLPLGAQTIEKPVGTISPRYEVVAVTSSAFTVSGNQACVSIYYDAGNNFTNATVYTFLQKLVNGVWRAASSTATCAWKDTSTEVTDGFEHYMTLTESGSYRAKFVYYIYGTNNKSDRIEEYIYRSYP